jgi:hypothetical protein
MTATNPDMARFPTMAHPRPRIGCSGWPHDDWKGPFYPETVKLKALVK